MNPSNEHLLVPEDKIRSALSALRVDREIFETGVRERIHQAEDSAVHRLANDDSVKYDGWTQVAAAVLPPSLLGAANASKIKLATSLTSVSIGKKLLGLLALPFATLILMLGGVLYAVQRIKRSTASDGQTIPRDDLDVASYHIFGRYYHFLSWLMLIGVSIGLWKGFVFPLLVILLASGFVVVLFVKRMGDAQLVDRQVIGQNLGSIALIAVQASLFSRDPTRVHLIDPFVTTAILTWGTVLLFHLSFRYEKRPGKGRFDSGSLVLLLLVQAAICFIAWKIDPRLGWIGIACSVVPLLLMTVRRSLSTNRFACGSLCFCVGLLFAVWSVLSLTTGDQTESIRKTAESVPAAANHLEWQSWDICAEWMTENDLAFDRTNAIKAMNSNIDSSPIGRRAGWFAGGLIDGSNVEQVKSYSTVNDWQWSHFLSEEYRNNPLTTDFDEAMGFEIRRRHLLDQIGQNNTKTIAKHILLSLDRIRKADIDVLRRIESLVSLLEFIGQPVDEDLKVRSVIHKTLSDYQWQSKSPKPGHRRIGGFVSSLKHPVLCGYATAAAIQLMQRFGAPDKVDAVAIRSYLQPRILAFQHIDPGVRAAMSARLESLPDVRPISWLDYWRYEKTTLLALILVGLCAYATVSAPYLDKKNNVPLPPSEATPGTS